MKKYLKSLLLLLMFSFAIWTAGCTSQKNPSGAAADVTTKAHEIENIISESTPRETTETSTAATETVAAQKETTKENVTEEVTEITAKEPATQETTEETIETATQEETTKEETTTALIAEDGVYTSKEDVALYLHTYGKLPSNFITKKQAEAYGWSGGGLDDYAYGTCIGGDKFGNYEGNLPTEQGRQYYECDIDTLHAKKRGAKRIVFSNDGLIYYTEDHYNTFERLYE